MSTNVNRILAAAVLLCALLTSRPVAQEHTQSTVSPAVAKVLYGAADAIGMLREVAEEDGIARVDFWAIGTITVGGQTHKLSKYRVSINYDDPGIRVDLTRLGADGKELPREIHVAAKGFAWDEKAPGSGAVPVTGVAEERLLQLWMTPPGIIKAAHVAGPKASVSQQGGATLLTFPVGSATLTATLNAKNLFDKVEARTGTTVIETTFSDFGELNDADYKADVFWPKRIVQKRGGTTTLDLTLTRTNTYNPYLVLPIPANVK